MRRYREFIQNHAGKIIIITFVLTIIFATRLPSLKIENDPGKFAPPPDHPVIKNLKAFEAQFGSGKPLILGIESDSLLSPSALETVKRLTEAISRLESVRNVYSLANARRIYWVPTLGAYSPRLGPLSGKKSHDCASLT